MIEAKFKEGRITLRGCIPHYRRPLAEIIALRHAIYEQLSEQGVALPIKKKVHLSIIATKHEATADLSNIIQAVCQALDGKTLSIDKKDIVLTDDSQVTLIRAQWLNS